MQHFGQACVLPGVVSSCALFYLKRMLTRLQWAMVGAAAALAGVTRMSISLAVIIMELTSSLTYVLPVMLSILLAKNVAECVSVDPDVRSVAHARTAPLSLEASTISCAHHEFCAGLRWPMFAQTIELNELPFLDAKLEYLHAGVTVADVLDTEAPVISLAEDNTLGSLRDLLTNTESSALAGGFPVLSSESGGKRLKAYIAMKELASGLASVEHRDDSTPCTFASMPMDASVMSSRTPGHCECVRFSRLQWPGGMMKVQLWLLERSSTDQLEHSIAARGRAGDVH